MEKSISYKDILNKELSKIKEAGITPRLLLHSCCAPCSSYVLEYLTEYFDITVYYYNPNISPMGEYEKRIAEQKRLISEMRFKNSVSFIEGTYNHDEFISLTRGLENLPEGGERCSLCYEMRLEAAAQKAAEINADYFTTTLSVSPYKNTAKLNTIGLKLAMEYGVPYLVSDFKKNNGYKRSIELSTEYGLYRQNFCGCIFSKKEAEERRR